MHRSTPAALVTLLVLWSVGAAIAADAAPEILPPPEEPDRYLRTPEAIADLSFTVEGREGWALSGVVFGVNAGHLVMAQFWSVAPDGTQGYIDESEFVDRLVEDFTDLPGVVLVPIGKDDYRLKGFTIGKGNNGEAFVDWVHLVDEDGRSLRGFLCGDRYRSLRLQRNRLVLRRYV